jgi:POT family proton-dependent oligopeptide transporter
MFKEHPKGLRVLFFTEMWERFSYYGMRAILLLFMTTDTAKEGLGLATDTAGAIYGLYTAGVYLLTLPGGWIADNILGQRKAIWYGGICIMTGHALLAIPGATGIFYAGLCFVAAGTGLLKPNISSIVGDLYPEKGARRDAGFSIFYMGINIGAILGQTAVAYFGEKVNWHLGFSLAAFGMLAGLIQYRTSQKSLGEIGLQPKVDKKIKADEPSNKLMAIALAVILISLLAFLQTYGYIDMLSPVGIAGTVGVLIVTVVLFFFIYVIVAGGLNTAEKKQTVVIFFLFVGAAMFWSGFEQAGSSLNLFGRDYTDRLLFGWELPTGWLQSINPIFIVIFAPVFGALWVKLAARNINPRTPLKFAAGLFLLAAGFLVMFFAAEIVATGTKVGMTWLILTYFLHTIGELTLSPVGLSATTKLAPRKYYSQMMGVWFVGSALGNLIAGLYAGNFDPENVRHMPDLFMAVVQFGIGGSILFLALSPWINRWVTIE